jgi:hypothetical protein
MKGAIAGLAVSCVLVSTLLAGSSVTRIRIVANDSGNREHQAVVVAFADAVTRNAHFVRLVHHSSEAADVELRLLTVTHEGRSDYAAFQVRQGQATLPLQLNFERASRDRFLREFVRKSLAAVLADVAAKDAGTQ